MLPSVIIAGDTTGFDYANSAYPSSAWTLKAYLVGPNTINVDGVANADDSFTVTIPATKTALLASGLFDLSIRVFQGTEAYTVESTTVDVRPNPAISPSKLVTAQRMVYLIERALVGQLEEGEAIEALSISGRSLTSINRLELLEERGYWVRELQAIRQARYGGTGIKSIQLIVGRL